VLDEKTFETSTAMLKLLKSKEITKVLYNPKPFGMQIFKYKNKQGERLSKN